MGGSEGVTFSDKEEKPTSETRYADLFEKLCPSYMAMGMSYDEYWNGDNDAPKYYRKAYKLKRKEKNYFLWLEGAYNYSALIDVGIFTKAFSKEKPKDYMANPIPIDKEEMHEDEERRNKEKALLLANYIKAATLKATEKGGEKNG